MQGIAVQGLFTTALSRVPHRAGHRRDIPISQTDNFRLTGEKSRVQPIRVLVRWRGHASDIRPLLFRCGSGTSLKITPTTKSSGARVCEWDASSRLADWIRTPSKHLRFGYWTASRDELQESRSFVGEISARRRRESFRSGLLCPAWENLDLLRKNRKWCETFQGFKNEIDWPCFYFILFYLFYLFIYLFYLFIFILFYFILFFHTNIVHFSALQFNFLVVEIIMNTLDINLFLFQCGHATSNCSIINIIKQDWKSV